MTRRSRRGARRGPGPGARRLVRRRRAPRGRAHAPLVRVRARPDASRTSAWSSSGDSVLGLVVTDMAYRAYPDLPEGSLAKLRAAIVNMTALADVARGLGLWATRAAGQGRGAERRARQVRASWPTRSRPCSARSTSTAGSDVRPRADRAALPAPHGGLRARRGRPRLQDDPAGARVAGAARDAGVPASRSAGPTTRRSSRPRCSWAGEPLGTGTGRSKKEAEQQAAREAHRAHLRAARRERAREGGDEVELPEVEVMRRDLEKDVVGRRIKEAEVKSSKNAMRVDPPPQDAQGLHVAPGGTQDREGRAARQVPDAAARLRRRAGGALRHERAVPARDRSRGAASRTRTSC